MFLNSQTVAFAIMIGLSPILFTGCKGDNKLVHHSEGIYVIKDNAEKQSDDKSAAVSVGDTMIINDKRYFIIQIMNSLDQTKQMRLLINDSISSRQIIEKNKNVSNFQKLFRCFEMPAAYLGDNEMGMVISVWDNSSGSITSNYHDVSVAQLAEANSCVEVVEVLSEKELLVMLTVGDGSGKTQQLYRYDLKNENLLSLYGSRFFSMMSEDGNNTEVSYHGWVKGGSLLVQIIDPQGLYSPIYRVQNPDVDELYYTFENIEFNQIALLTNKLAEADLRSNFKEDYKNGLRFKIGEDYIFVPWY